MRSEHERAILTTRRKWENIELTVLAIEKIVKYSGINEKQISHALSFRTIAREKENESRARCESKLSLCCARFCSLTSTPNKKRVKVTRLTQYQFENYKQRKICCIFTEKKKK